LPGAPWGCGDTLKQVDEFGDLLVDEGEFFQGRVEDGHDAAGDAGIFGVGIGRHLAGEAGEVLAGELESVEMSGGLAGVDEVGLKQADDAVDSHLEAGGVGDEGQGEEFVFGGLVVIAAELAALEGGAAAGLAVVLDVSAARSLLGVVGAFGLGVIAVAGLRGGLGAGFMGYPLPPGVPSSARKGLKMNDLTYKSQVISTVVLPWFTVVYRGLE